MSDRCFMWCGRPIGHAGGCAPKTVPPNMRLVSQEALDNAIKMLVCPMVYQKCVDRRARGENVCVWCQAREGLQA